MSPVFDRKCRTCPVYRDCRDSFKSWIYFLIGLIATVAIRVVTLFGDQDPLYGKIAWYVGVVGFFIFFLYKYLVSKRREREIKRLGLYEKISRNEQLTADDYYHLGGILCGLRSNKEKINYFFIFFTSVIALALAIVFDFFSGGN